MNKRASYMVVFLIGFVFYPLIEIAYRSYTHISMAFLGGVCMVMILLTSRMLYPWGILRCAFFCALVITLLEFIFGVVLNIFMGLEVWSYSAAPLNIMGQVCLGYSFCWFLISIPATLLCRMLNKFTD